MRLLAGLGVASLFLLVSALPVFAAGPTREVIDLNDPVVDAEESAFVSDLCGFPIEADVSGHIAITTFTDGSRSVFELDHYAVRATYTNPETGETVNLRDMGPDRFFIKKGVAYVAVTGRSETGTGVVGTVVINLETGEIVRSAGREVGIYTDRLCDALS
jgi:hypothetical protein